MDGKLNPKILAKFFKRPYVFKQKEEVVNVFEFFEKNWDKLKNCNHEHLKIDQIRENFNNCVDIDHDDQKISWLKKQLSYINIRPNHRKF